MNKEQAKDFVKDQISKLRAIPQEERFQSGYCNGLIAGFFHSGLITVDEFDELIDLLTEEIRS